MEFPHGHHHHHHDGRDEERRPMPPVQEYGYGREEGYARPPPVEEYGYGREEGYGRPPPVQEHGYGREEGYGRPAPPRSEQYGYGGAPPAVQHGYGGSPPAVQHGYGGAPPAVQHGYGGTPPAAAVQHVSHTSHHLFPHGSSSSNDPMEKLMKQPTVRIYCKANEDVSLAIRGSTVLLVTTNKNDESQHWIKDLKYSTKVKDEEGYPAFSLINKATRQALKHSLGQSHPVLVTEYDPEKLDSSVLWTESRDVGDKYRCIRMVSNIYLNFDAFHGDEKHGGVHDGTTLDLWKWTEGDNQRWKIVSWCKNS